MSQPSEQKEESSSEQKQQQTSQASEKKEQPSQPQSESSIPASPPKEEPTTATTQKPQKYTSTLLPAVVQLLHQNGYHDDEADKITPTGPNGRILKGDVLAYLGRISKEYPVNESKRLFKQSHLDLSNITPAKPKPADTQKQEQKAVAAEPDLPAETELAVPISLAAVIATQKRVQDTLGIWLPLSTFIARASELANEDLPARKGQKPTSDDLFNSVLGVSSIPRSSRGHFIPQITGISPPVPALPVRKPDIIDMLAPRSVKGPVPKMPVAQPPMGINADGNVFSVTAKNGDEARAAEYLERMKLALEKEPGRLVL